MATRKPKKTTSKTRQSGRTPKSKSSVPPPDAPPRIARVAKGKKPQYFSDPAIDKLLWMTVTLMEELSVTRDRLDTVERLLTKKRVLKATEVDLWRPDPKSAVQRDARRKAFVDRMMRAVHAELDEVLRGNHRGAEDDPVAAVES
jgi:hypothetical protein